MAGRFAYLLDAADQKQLAHTYAAPTGSDDVVAVRLSFPPRRVHNENVVRVGRLATDVVSLSEHPDGDVISIDDLAVTADPDQLYLVRRSTGQRVIAHIPHALDTTMQTPPLARFIAEAADARSAVFGPLDLGAAARTLPYTPCIRYRRTVLAPARCPDRRRGHPAVRHGRSDSELGHRRGGPHRRRSLGQDHPRVAPTLARPGPCHRLPRRAAPAPRPRPTPRPRPAADPPVQSRPA